LQPERDRCLRWGAKKIATNGRAVKDSATLCLYYWLPEYWLTQELLIVELYWDDRASMEAAWRSPEGEAATKHLDYPE